MPDIQPRFAAARLIGAAAVLLLALAALPAAAQDPEEYALRAQETISIKVGKWDPVQGIYTDWPSLGGEYRIGPAGRFSMPMAGEIAAAGLTPEELAATIRDKLNRAMGHDGRIEAAVTVADFAPIYVLGAVQSPGAYAYAPGLTVVQGLTLAGGMPRGATAFLRTERSALASLGEYRVMELELLRHLATAARLQAELDGAAEIPVPERVDAAPMGQEFMSREREIFEARQASFETSLSQLADLEALLRERVSSLNEQIALRDEQLDLLREELSNAAQLVERGLSVESRRSSLQRQVADQEVRGLELETALLNAEQNLNEVDQDRSNLINDRRRFLVENIRSERSEIAKLEVRMETQAALYSEALQYGDGFMQQDAPGAPIFLVTRRTDGGTTTLELGRTDPLRPGDVLEVTLPGPEGQAAAPEAAPAASRLPGDVLPGADAPPARLESALPAAAGEPAPVLR